MFGWRTTLAFGSSIALGVCTACDLGQGSDPSNAGAAQIDPNEQGSDRDVGDGDIGPTPVERHGQLSVRDGQLQDENGQPVQLKGVSSMWLNWENDGYAESAPALRWMRNNWNLTVIRAAMGIEPSGAYLTNPALAQMQVERIVQNAIDAGVYVIIDWHDHHAHEHQAQAVEFFSMMARTFGDQPNVLYEPYNEPLDVNWSAVVKPYHEAVIAAIRAEDPDNVVIVGSPHWSQDVDVAASDPVSDSNVMYTLHFYACSHTATQRGKAERARSQGLPLFVTEWGATHADGGTDGVVCLSEAATWLEWLDQNRIGWTAWKLDNCPRDSSCILKPHAPLTGGWTSAFLNGHALFVRANMQEEAPVEAPEPDSGAIDRFDAGQIDAPAPGTDAGNADGPESGTPDADAR